MKIRILSDASSWKNQFIPLLQQVLRRSGHKVQWVHDEQRIARGDLLFLLGCTKLVPAHVLERNRHNIVFHESGLPKGKGWSPLSWQILEEKNRIPVTLFEAVERVDAGPVYLRGVIPLKGHELLDEIRLVTARIMTRMLVRFVGSLDRLVRNRTAQHGRSTYYARRTRADLELNTRQSLQQQFNVLRIADPSRYPAFFKYRGHAYEIRITKRTDRE